MKDFRQLMVWEKAHRLTLLIYEITKKYPKDELFGLTSQTKRACSSIPANIAEGCGKRTDADFARFLQISFGSACELEYHLLLAYDLKILDLSNYKKLENLLLEVKKMLASLIKKLQTNS